MPSPRDVAAPALAGVLVALFGVRWVFWFDAATYFVSAALVLCAKLPARTAELVPPFSARAFLVEVTHGTRVLLREPSLRQALTMSLAEATAGAAALHGLRHRWAQRALLVGGSVLGLVLLPGALVPPFLAFSFLWMLNGASQALIAIPSSTLLAEHTREDERGRAYAAHFALTHFFWLIAYPAVGHAAVR